MATYVQDLFTVAMGGGSVRRFGGMAVLQLPSIALVTTPQEFQDAQRWARSRNTTGDEAKDRAQMLAQLQTIVAPPGTSLDTRGQATQLVKLAGIMRSEGMDLEAWCFPQAVRDSLPPAPPVAPPPLVVGRLVRRSA
ncbi:MAG TPA: hypothetical protein VGE22_20825 [Solimonas sp.]